MRFRRVALILLAMVFTTASSFASICDVSCSFVEFHPARPGMVHSRPAPSVDVKMNMAAGADHSCCQRRDQDSAVIVPHLAMSPDCAIDPALRTQFPTAVEAHVLPIHVHAVQAISVRIVSPSAAETPPTGPNYGNNINVVVSPLSLVLRV